VLLLSFDSHAARVYGKVTDENKVPLPFATLHVKNTTLGTTSNAEGSYSIDLPSGTYELIFQYVWI
jgi:hypothetical protein